MTGDGAAAWPRRSLHGRRSGKKLGPSQLRLMQSLLPQLRIAGVRATENPDRKTLAGQALFGDARPVWLEIGFGAGEHLVHQAQANPDIGLVGCEPFVNGVAAALGRIEAAGIGNVRLHPGDARDLIEVLPAGLLGRVFLLYPDPWPKRRHSGRRFASRENLALLRPAMAAGAELRIATDIAGYAAHALAEVAASPGWRIERDTTVPWEGWCGTRYEAKALLAGRVPRYLTFVRV